jgi:signal transduction histidine kinase
MKAAYTCLNDRDVELESVVMERNDVETETLSRSAGYLPAGAGSAARDITEQKNLERQSSAALLSLINGLLDLAEIESGKVEVNLQRVVCQEVVEAGKSDQRSHRIRQRLREGQPFHASAA